MDHFLLSSSTYSYDPLFVNPISDVRDLISMPPTEAKEKNLAVLIKPLKEAPPKRGDLEGATSGANTADSAQDAEDLPALIKKGGDKEKRPQQWKAWGSITQGNKKKETGRCPKLTFMLLVASLTKAK